MNDVWLSAIVSGVVSGLAGGLVGARLTLRSVRKSVSQSSQGNDSPNVISGSSASINRPARDASAKKDS